MTSGATFDPGFAERPTEPKTSALAVTALVSSLIFCCPLTTILGVLLGLVAFIRIRADAALRGGWLAILAVLVGVVATSGQWWAFTAVKTNIVEPMMKGPEEALRVGFAGDVAAFKDSFYGAGAAASDEEAQAFLDALRDRYGDFQGSTYNQQRQPAGGPVMEFNYLLRFDNGSVPAEVQIVFADESTSAWPRKLGFIAVSDPDQGDLVYPPGLDVAATRGTIP